MILIFANRNDLCASQTYAYLKNQNQDVFFIDMVSDFLSDWGVNWSLACLQSNNFFTVNSRKFSFEDVTGVLARGTYPNYKDNQLSEKDINYIRSECNATLVGLLHFLEEIVINPPQPGLSQIPVFANEKQISKILESGFKLPNTIVTSSFDSALSFYNTCNQIAIVGLPWSQFPSQLVKEKEGGDYLETLIDRQKEAIYLQEVPNGKWIQAFVVGEKVFGSSFWFKPIEQEKQIAPFQKIELLPKLQEQCQKLAKGLKLKFLQLRLLQTESDDIYCFDINGFPSYIQCEKKLQEEIVIALAELLQKGEGGVK